ncbi:MAG: acyl-CoA thioesterase [Candidatus Saccharibacteria bacterium]
MIQEKTAADSLTKISTFALPHMANPLGSIHGGETMKLMDNAAAVCAMRHSNSLVVTLFVDNLDFFVPIYAGELVVCTACLTYVGRSSMEVEVVVSAENPLQGLVATALKGYFTMVALDDKFKTIEVPRLKLLTDEDKMRFEEGRARAEQRKVQNRVRFQR